ncbi:MAG: hypothetical protein EOO99_11900 [Pedobacter sp.]|nr:MAG: hypothetical protein EOO99_11900 [Pedobacter sp.]
MFDELYNQRGKKIGEDEKGVNGKVRIVTDSKEVSRIEANTKNKAITQSNTISSGISVSKAALSESLNVLDRTIANGGLQEEVSIVMNSGAVIQGQTGPVPTITNNIQTAPSTLPNLPTGATIADVEATIHSHPIAVQQVGFMIYPQSANSPSSGSGSDQITFRQFGTNIIIGPLGTINPNSVTINANGSLNIPSRPNGAVIYDINSIPKVELKRDAILRIINK